MQQGLSLTSLRWSLKVDPNIKVGLGHLFMWLELGSNSKSIWSINKGFRSGFCSASASRISSSGLRSSAPDSDEKSRFRNWQQIRRFSAEHGQPRSVFLLLTLIQVAAISKIKPWPWNLWNFALSKITATIHQRWMLEMRPSGLMWHIFY